MAMTGDIPSFQEWLRSSGAYGKQWTPGNTARDAYNREMAMLQRRNNSVGLTPGGTRGGGSRTTDGKFNLNPAPTGGNGPYGLVPGPLGLPDPHGDLAKVLPGLDALNAKASSDILAQLSGELSPETTAALTNMAAERGVAGGMPGAQTWNHLLLGNVAGAMEALRDRGVANYNALLPTISKTQTVDPNLQADIANQNAVNAAAPDPGAAASEAERLYMKYRNSMGGGGPGGGSGGGGGPAGGTGGLGLPPMPTMPSYQPTNTTTGTGNASNGWAVASNSDGGFGVFGNPPAGNLPLGFGETQGPPAPKGGAPYQDNFWDEFNSWSF